MPKFNKSRGFKMKGFSYPGTSPLKGKKKMAQQAVADQQKSAAEGEIAKLAEKKVKSTDIMSQ